MQEEKIIPAAARRLGFNGVLIMYRLHQVYHTIEKEREDLKIAGCWAHARRRFDEALKAMPKGSQKHSSAYKALAMIFVIVCDFPVPGGP